MQIPLTVADVTPDWLSDVLGVPVTARRLTRIGQGVGIMGDIYRAELESPDPATPASVVVKLPSSAEENRAQGVALGMFEAEVRFYRELAQEAPVGLPEVYGADIRSGTAEFVIVMEDLSALTLVEQSDGMSAAQAEAAVRVLGAVHAVWWDQAQSPDMAWIPTMTGPRIQFVDQLLVQLLPQFLAMYADSLPSGAVELYERFTGNYLTINRVLAERSPWTLAHQDFRVENLLFGADRVVVLDWQGIGRGPGAYDLAYLLGGSMATERRREHEARLLGAYFESLQGAGVRGYSRDQLAEDYAHSQLMGGLATAMVVGGGMDLSNERGRVLGTTMARRHAAAALDHDGLARLSALDA